MTLIARAYFRCRQCRIVWTERFDVVLTRCPKCLIPTKPISMIEADKL